MYDEITIKKKINELQSLKTDFINHYQYSKVSKIPFKVHSFIEIINCRMIDFCEAIDILIKNNHVVPSLPLIRALFENIAISNRIVSAIENSLLSNKLVENFDDLITIISFGTRYDGEDMSINILTQIDNLDKKYKGIKKSYNSLCEFVHPNWDGVGGSYSELNENDNTTEILKLITTEHLIFEMFESYFLLCMEIHIFLTKYIISNLKDFAVLCEANIKTNTLERT